MKLSRPVRRTPPETIIALIDVVFFLLIFFMLIGRMDASAPFEVRPPVAGSGRDMPGGGITVSVGIEGELALDGTAMDEADVLAGIAARLASEPGLTVRLNADGRAALRQVLPLSARIESLGAGEVVLIVTPAAGAP